MGNIIRAEVSENNPYWIEKHRYYELNGVKDAISSFTTGIKVAILPIAVIMNSQNHIW